MVIPTSEALYIIKGLIKDDVESCCEALMDKDEVIIKLQKIKDYIQNINDKENPVDLHSALDGYY